MGLILKQVQLEDYTERAVLYGKAVRGSLPFKVIVDVKDNISIQLYRDHPRMQEFVEKNDIHKTMNLQKKNITQNIQQLKLNINDDTFMITGCDGMSINIVEYNLPNDLGDCPKGKAAILFNIIIPENVDNTKVINELKALM